MKKLLNVLLILTPLMGYLEWADQHTFLYKIEYDLLFNFNQKKDAFLHPFVLLPLLGQLLLVVTLFQREPNKKLTLAGIFLISILMILIFVVGILAKTAAIVLYATPFLVTAGITVWVLVKKK
jgi:hypothetical protein